MFDSQATYIIKNWGLYDSKLFKYVRELVPNEYVIFSRSTGIISTETGDYKSGTIFVTNKEKSTFILPDLSESAIIKMMTKEELIYIKEYHNYEDITVMKTDGCDCGAWIMGKEASKGCHSSWCLIYMNPHKD